MTSSSTIALLSPPSQIQEALVFGNDSDVQDPLLCRDITDEVVHNMRLVEVSRKPHKDYMERTHVIEPGRRARCVEWLTDMAEEICKSPNTLYLAVNYLDGYLSSANNENENLDFVGMTCLLIALKHEEVEGHFSFDRYTYIVGHSVEDFVRMEYSIISSLEYDLAGPTVYTFLGRYIRVAYLGMKKNNNEEEEEGYDLKHDLELMASYLARISLVSYRMIGYSSSLVAASSVFLAQYITDPSERPWSRALQRYTGYEASDLRECVLELEAARDMYGWVTWICPLHSIPPQFFTNFS